MGLEKNGWKNTRKKQRLKKGETDEANEDKKETEKRMNESRNNCKTKKTMQKESNLDSVFFSLTFSFQSGLLWWSHRAQHFILRLYRQLPSVKSFADAFILHLRLIFSALVPAINF